MFHVEGDELVALVHLGGCVAEHSDLDEAVSTWARGVNHWPIERCWLEIRTESQDAAG